MSGKKGSGRNLQWLKDHVGHTGDECLIWPFGRNENGYGQVKYGDKTTKASRVMCILVKGEPPEPRFHAAHSCHNGHLGCVHPKHLDWKTPSQNTREYIEQNGGTVNHTRRLTLDQVETIRASSKSYIELAAEYGVHKNTIGKIFRGKTWTKPRSTLTREQLQKIRDMSSAGHRTIDISREVGANYQVVHRTRYKELYRDT